MTSGRDRSELVFRGVPPWEIGRAQATVVELAGAGRITGSVLDVGYGTRERSLELARLGHRGLGVDASPTAIGRARARASQSGSGARFLVWDALDLASLGEQLDTIVDAALFHIVSDRRRYVEQLGRALRPGGLLFLLEISGRAEWRYPRVTQGRSWRLSWARPGEWNPLPRRGTRFETARCSGGRRASAVDRAADCGGNRLARGRTTWPRCFVGKGGHKRRWSTTSSA